jgi:hypothetical protein
MDGPALLLANLTDLVSNFFSAEYLHADCDACGIKGSKSKVTLPSITHHTHPHLLICTCCDILFAGVGHNGQSAATVDWCGRWADKH